MIYLLNKKLKCLNYRLYFNKMDEPVSPTTILMPPTIAEDLNVGLNPQDIHNAAQVGFDYLKTKLQKTKLTPGDILLEFWNYNEPETTDQLVPLFCLSIIILVNMKTTLNDINPEIYNKLFSYTVNLFNTKSM
mgnify:CR=1 FL=1